MVTADELRRLVDDGEIGAAVGRPFAVVDDPDSLRGWSPGAVPVVLVAVGSDDEAPPADHPCDVVVDPDGAPGRALLATVAGQPLAATTAAVLYRSTPWRDVETGLAVESAVYSMLQAGPEFRAWLADRPPAAPRPDDRPVLVDRAGDQVTITLNRPRSHNAVDEALRAALADALRFAVIDESIVRITLRGSGPSFCSGGDLRTFGAFADVSSAHASRLTRSPGRLVHALRDRLGVILHGSCLGAGIEVPAFAGHVAATPDARLGLPEVGFGLIPGAGGTVSIPRRIGRHRAARLALSATPIDAATALAWGLIDEIVEQPTQRR